MKANFDSALAQCLKWEGGYSFDPDDRGGATNRGIIQTRYDQYRDDHHLPRRSVKLITDTEVETIYRIYYWNVVQGDTLPAIIDTVVFDAAVNHGPARAAKWLQELVGATPDGVIGAKTIAAVTAATADVGIAQEKALATKFCDRREQFYEEIAVGNQHKWLKGWLNRLADLRKRFGLVDTDGAA